MNGTLYHFLTNGDLDGLKLGHSIDRILQRAGPPEDTSFRKEPLIWKYGGLELTFENGALSFIALYFRKQSPHLPTWLRIEGWCPARGTSEAAVLLQLDKWNIVPQLIEQLTFDSYRAYRAGLAVISFDVGHKCLLDSMMTEGREICNKDDKRQVP